MIIGHDCCCYMNEPVIFGQCVLKLGHRFHALLKVCSDCDDLVPLRFMTGNYASFAILVLVFLEPHFPANQFLSNLTPFPCLHCRGGRLSAIVVLKILKYRHINDIPKILPIFQNCR